MEPFDFVNRANAEFIDRLYEQYRRDPRQLEPKWQAFFAGFEVGFDRTAAGEAAGSGDRKSGVPLTMGIYDLVHSYRELGHFVSDLDPLGHNRPNHPLLDLSNFARSEERR